MLNDKICSFMYFYVFFVKRICHYYKSDVNNSLQCKIYSKTRDKMFNCFSHLRQQLKPIVMI